MAPYSLRVRASHCVGASPRRARSPGGPRSGPSQNSAVLRSSGGGWFARSGSAPARPPRRAAGTARTRPVSGSRGPPRAPSSTIESRTASGGLAGRLAQPEHRLPASLLSHSSVPSDAKELRPDYRAVGQGRRGDQLAAVVLGASTASARSTSAASRAGTGPRSVTRPTARPPPATDMSLRIARCGRPRGAATP